MVHLRVLIICLTILVPSVYTQPSSFIIGGQPSEVNFLAYIVSKESGNTEFGYLFTGSLITRTHILTVAQAVNGYKSWRVGVGSHVVNDMKFLCSETAHQHPDFHPVTLNNNLAIIIVPEDDSTLGIAMPTLNNNPTLPSFVQSLGFGTRDANNIQDLPDTLQIETFGTMSNELCQNFYGNSIVNENIVCLQSFGTSFLCYGDQGGPVILALSTTIVAINSFWMSPCNGPEPSGHIRINFYLDWIESVTNLNN